MNIIPVIAKADTLLKSELIALKKQLLTDIDKHGVQLYDFPEGDSEQDEESSSLDKALKVREIFFERISFESIRNRFHLQLWEVMQRWNPMEEKFVRELIHGVWSMSKIRSIVI